MSGLVIEPEAIKRLAKDVKQLIKNPLHDNRIFINIMKITSCLERH